MISRGTISGLSPPNIGDVPLNRFSRRVVSERWHVSRPRGAAEIIVARFALPESATVGQTVGTLRPFDEAVPTVVEGS